MTGALTARSWKKTPDLTREATAIRVRRPPASDKGSPAAYASFADAPHEIEKLKRKEEVGPRVGRRDEAEHLLGGGDEHDQQHDMKQVADGRREHSGFEREVREQGAVREVRVDGVEGEGLELHQRVERGVEHVARTDGAARARARARGRALSCTGSMACDCSN